MTIVDKKSYIIFIVVQLTQAPTMAAMVSCGRRDTAKTYYSTDIMVFEIYIQN